MLSISHGNTAPENGLSINKAMLDVHGYSLGESTIEVLRFVKDAILKHSSILDIPITRSQLDNVKGYGTWLTWKLREPLKKKRKQKEKS